jgi:hypothetical protein
MKGRGDHPSFDLNGFCRRCGCRSTEKRCPPGYWMTQHELVGWDEADDAGRERMEARLSALRHKGNENKENGT